MGCTESCFNKQVERRRTSSEYHYQALSQFAASKHESAKRKRLKENSPESPLLQGKGSDVPYLDTKDMSPERKEELMKRRQRIANKHKRVNVDLSDGVTAGDSPLQQLPEKLNERGKKLAEAEENAEKLRCTTAEFERDAREFAKKKQGKMHR